MLILICDITLKFVFMDVLTYDQIEIEEEIIGEQSNYLDDGMEVTINFHEKELLRSTYLKHVKLKFYQLTQ